MNMVMKIVGGLLAIGGLSACNSQNDAPTSAQSSAAASSDMSNMSDMPTAAETKQGAGVGTVTAIDPAQGTIKLDHGAIAELGWPAMEMSFAAEPAALSGIEIGEQVEFEVSWDGTSGHLTAVRPVAE